MKEDKKKHPQFEDALGKDNWVKGNAKIVATNVKTGEVRVLTASDNLVVSGFYENLRYALGNYLPATRYINRIYLGTNGTAPTFNDTSVTNPPGGPVYVSVTASQATYGVTFSGTLGTDEGNDADNAYAEMGLYTAGNVLVARKRFDQMKKSSDWTWTLTWSLTWPT